MDLVLHSNRRSEAAKEEAARFQNPPCTLQHGLEVIVAAGKVQDGATDNNVSESGWEGHCFDSFQSEVVHGESWRDRCGELTRCIESPRIRIRPKHFKAFPEEVYKVATRAAARIKDPHTGSDALPEELIEQIDIDPSELVVKVGHADSIIQLIYIHGAVPPIAYASQYRSITIAITDRLGKRRHIVADALETLVGSC
jgi:hypothetical protein